MKTDPAAAAINRLLLIIGVPLACLVWHYELGPLFHAAAALSK